MEAKQTDSRLAPGDSVALESLGVYPQQILTHRVNCQLQSSVHLPSGNVKLEEMPFPNLIGLGWKDVYLGPAVLSRIL